jgi:hypothetical protein
LRCSQLLGGDRPPQVLLSPSWGKFGSFRRPLGREVYPQWGKAPHSWFHRKNSAMSDMERCGVPAPPLSGAEPTHHSPQRSLMPRADHRDSPNRFLYTRTALRGRTACNPNQGNRRSRETKLVFSCQRNSAWHDIEQPIGCSPDYRTKHFPSFQCRTMPLQSLAPITIATTLRSSKLEGIPTDANRQPRRAHRVPFDVEHSSGQPANTRSSRRSFSVRSVASGAFPR